MIRALPPVYRVGDTVYCFFPAYDSAGASVTITGLAVTDIEVYKNGSTTQRASDNGYALLDTDGVDFDGMTGIHGFSIDTSDNSDVGFYVNGAHLLIAVDAITIDGQTVRFAFEVVLGVLPTVTEIWEEDVGTYTGSIGKAARKLTAINSQTELMNFDSNNQLNVNLVAILDEELGETTPGRIAGNFGGLFDNNDVPSSRALDDLSTFNQSSDQVKVNGFLGGTLTETTAGRIAGNFDTFFENADAATSRVVDEVGGGALLTGPNTVTITINDGTNPIENARVRMYRTGESETKLTDTNGQVQFTVAGATWSVAVAAINYVGQTNTLVVSGNVSQAYSLVENSVAPPSDPTLSLLSVLCVDEAGAVEEGVTIYVRIKTVPSGSTGYAYDGTSQSGTSAANGQVTFNVVRQAVYQYKRGTSQEWTDVTIPNTPTCEVTSVIGQP